MNNNCLALHLKIFIDNENLKAKKETIHSNNINKYQYCNKRKISIEELDRSTSFGSTVTLAVYPLN